MARRDGGGSSRLSGVAATRSCRAEGRRVDMGSRGCSGKSALRMGKGFVVADPVPQRLRSPRRLEAGSRCSDASSGGTPATYSHDAASERVQWLPPADYRVRHDVGLSGYAGDGLPDPGFHGWWAERNGAFADLMVRTGWRLTEQASLTAFEVPTTSAGRGHQRFRLPASIAKADPRGGGLRRGLSGPPVGGLRRARRLAHSSPACSRNRNLP